ncbi:hypothetical protein LCGC14_1870810 [marine sediment metagenome]|uniref:Uncharacterized protein n=1 Tax=marine sediment metagenome TaxID=412755 RepID=A0A0F9GT68_9ZZZZ
MATQKAITCDLCVSMKEEFIDEESGKIEPQCILVCPKEAISLKDVEQIGEEKQIDAVKRLFTDILKESED